MKSKIIISIIIFSLIPFWSAFSQEKQVAGEISLTGKYVGIEGENGGKAKFTEYKDLQENGGIYGRMRLNLDTEKYFLNFNSGNFGYDTSYYQMDGGLWGKFQVDLFYREIPHSITFDARTFYQGAGGDTLTGTPNPNVSSWNTFDYSSERRQLGGGLKFNLIKPFFFDASYEREERYGIKPTGAPGDPTDSGNATLELPEPTHYLTNNLKFQTGYAKNPLYLSLNYFYSDFNNSNTVLNFFSPITGVNETHSLPPDNTYHKGSFKGAFKLPLNTKFSTNFGFSRGRSETSAFPTTLGPPAGRTDFKGKVKTLNYDAVLTSNPVRFLDARVFYKFYKRDNRSENPFGLIEGFLDYKTNTVGIDLGFRLPAKFYLTGGYEYAKTKRDFHADPLEVLPHNVDHKYVIELKWSGLDFLETRVGYEKFKRDAKYQSPETSMQLDRKYAYARQDRDTLKTAIDIFPFENLNLGLEYRHRKIDYTDSMLGLKKEKRDEFSFSVDYSIGKIVKLFGNTDYGLIKFTPDLQRSGLNWSADQKDKTFGYGLGAEIYAIPNKLTFILQHHYLKSNGNVDMTIDPGLFATAGIAGANNELVDISRWDDYTLYGFKIKTIYHFTKNLTASIGYGYERFNYKDAQSDGYQFIPGGGAGNNGAYLTGAYKDQSYRAHLIFGGITYKF
jgi:MtrB/PioB family decaheme-associated outer membrane protein